MTETAETTTDAGQTANETVDSSTTQTEAAETATPETVSKKDFNKVYWKSKNAEREIEELKQKISQNAEQNQTVLNTPDTVQNSVPDNEPTLEQFDYDSDAYTAALVDHRVNAQVNKAFNDRDNQRKEKKQQEENNSVSEKYNDRYAEYSANNPEYREIAEVAGPRNYGGHINQAILHADNGPQIDHYLLTNHDVAEKLKNLNPVVAAIEIGKISAQLSAKTKTINTTNAPAPIETVGGGSGTVKDSRYVEGGSMEDYYKSAMVTKRGG